MAVLLLNRYHNAASLPCSRAITPATIAITQGKRSRYIAAESKDTARANSTKEVESMVIKIKIRKIRARVEADISNGFCSHNET